MSVLAPPRESEALRRLAALSGQNLYACYQCGKCTAGCPFSFSPQQVVRHLQLGQVARAAALDTVWDCASCMTCTATCPKGVDPARIMRALRALPCDGDDGRPAVGGAEHGPLGIGGLGGRRPSRHGNRRRAWMVANNHRLARVGSRLAPVSNWLLRAPGMGWATDRLLGVHRDRPLPPFARPTFPTWFGRHTPSGDGHRGTVLLFHDTFMDFNFPDAGIAATELLERAGFRVELTDTVCCGRPMISKGMLGEARDLAAYNVARLAGHARQGLPIVGLEPSCLLTLRDEYVDLLRSEESRLVAKQSLLLEEFVQRELAAGRRPAFAPGNGRKVLLHGHCHQKALVGTAPTVAVLKAAGYEVSEVDAGCCGMAGSFGFEAEHYELSLQIAGRRLVPAVKAAGPEVAVCAPGISCRQQIEHTTGRRAKHPAELLFEALAR